MSIHSLRPPPAPRQQLCREEHLIHQLLQTIDGPNASAPHSGQHKNCVDLFASVQHVTQHLDDVTSADLHTPNAGLVLYAFATPFILIIGNIQQALYD